MDIYVGNVSFDATETDLEVLFKAYGKLTSVRIIRRNKGKSEGYGVIKIENQEAAERAIESLNGRELMGRSLRVQKWTAFHNPYTFVPSPPRRKGGFAGDFDPLECGLDHASLNDGCWTGHIPIKLTTVTPLVLLKDDGRERDSKEHQIYDVHDHIPESSLRGMLRSAYEVVTNSRYGCFGKEHEKQLTYRIGKKKKKHPKSPADILDSSLKPAQSMNQLSPADRLFGWTPQGQGKDRGYKSRLRVVCENIVGENAVSEDNKKSKNDKQQGIIQHFKDDGTLPLTILSKPKPSYVYFYVGKNKQGESQRNGLTKEQAGYKANKGLRGRKQYWHHRGLEEDKQKQDYWKASVEDRTQVKRKERYQEYRRPDKCPDDQNPKGWQQKDGQNRSITGWIKPGVEFKASLYVQNLRREEVGALLWLLTLHQHYKEDHYFRLGYGKPLGFGSVKMEVDLTDPDCINGCLPLANGEDWKAYYATFDADTVSLAKLAPNQQKECIQDFQFAMKGAYEQPNFDDLPFISGFLQVLRGPKSDAPIHYPRKTSEPNPDGGSFNWFRANDDGKGLKLSLPEVTAAEGLPSNPSEK